MIVHRSTDGELFDQEAVSVENRVSVRTVRRRCEPVACDVKTRAPLYDADAAGHILAGVVPRPARCATEQRHRQSVPAR